jgi:membrane protease YdiL (CAAX protease family)
MVIKTDLIWDLVGDLERIYRQPWKRPLQLFAIVFALALFSQLITAEVTLETDEALLLMVGFYAIIFAAVFAFLRQGGEGISNLGLRASGLWMTILLAAVLGFVAQLIWMVIISVASGSLVFNFGAMSGGTFFATVLVGAVLVGFVEEGAFRGYIQRKFASSYGFIRALILTSFLFMIIHVQFYTLLRLADPSVMAQATQQLGLTQAQVWEIMQFAVTQTVIMISALGLFLGYLYFKSGQNLLPPAAFHITFNVGGLLALSYSNAQLAALSLDYGLFVALGVLWVGIVGALIWAVTKTEFFRITNS